ncbi:MAG: sugar ABC transporter substrate-binding protein [Eubacteriales bacterium]|nr:sugar ABC transporter substrate-binding protein [Eubacteriales bacterium]
MKHRKSLWAAAFLGGVILGMAGCRGIALEGERKGAQLEEQADAGWEVAERTPYGRYPELVTYTLCQMSGANNSNLPQGATYEDNEYTRYLRRTLNIQNKNTYMEREDRYNEYVNVLVKDRNLPDIMVLNSRETLKELVENQLVEDLTEVYESCTSDRIKEMYDSYGGQLLDAGTFGGRLMALPEAVIDHGPCLLWLRKDWMEELGLSAPENMEEAFEVIASFMEHGMGAGEGEEPIGLVCGTSLVGTTSESYSVDPIFALFGAHPKRWVEDEEGKLVYGSLTEETKEAISCLRRLYDRGILDQNFALRAQNNLRDLVVEGRCGAFFGLWWTPNNPLMDVLEADPKADWEPYYLTAQDPEEDVPFYNSFRDNKYVVVRKGYEHPEIVMKTVSVLFDYSRYQAEDAEDINSYFGLNVDPTARPLVINVDYNEATYTVTENIRKTMAGDRKEEELSAIEKSYYDACMNYLEGDQVTVEDWAAYKSRISAVGLLIDGGYTPPSQKYLAESDGEMPQLLEDLERDSFIQIIMGRQPLSYFDTFVREWYAQGGAELTKKLRQENPPTT